MLETEPWVPDKTLTDLAQLTSELSSRYSKAINDWLESLVEVWCPPAYECAKAHCYHEAQQLLLDGGYHWTQESLGGDGVLTFWKHDVPIARCRLEIQFLNSRGKASS